MIDMEIWIPEQILIFQKFHHPQIEPLRSSRKLYQVYLQGMIGWKWIKWVHKISCEVILVYVIYFTLNFGTTREKAYAFSPYVKHGAKCLI